MACLLILVSLLFFQKLRRANEDRQTVSPRVCRVCANTSSNPHSLGSRLMWGWGSHIEAVGEGLGWRSIYLGWEYVSFPIASAPSIHLSIHSIFKEFLLCILHDARH